MERPKRRKYGDNPYILKQNGNHYYILFKDSQNIIRTVEVIKKYMIYLINLSWMILKK